MVNDIIDNNILTVESLDSKLKVKKVSGGVRQATREGYNLFNSDKALTSQTKTQGGATVTKNNDKSFTVTGSGNLTASFGGGYIDYTHEETLKILKTGQYTCYFGAITYPLCAIQFFKKENDKETLLISRDNGSNIKAVISITNEIINSTGVFLRLSFYGASGKAIVPGTIYPMICEGTEEKPYEAYGASPSPDYPSEVEVVGDNVNLFDKDNADKKNIYINYSTKKIIASGNATSIILKCSPNKIYTISRTKILANDFVVGVSNTYPENDTTLTSNVNGNGKLNVSITTSDSDNYLIVYCKWGNIEYTIEEILNTIKIEEGSVATSYSPYGMGSLEINKVNKNWFDKKSNILSQRYFGTSGQIETSAATDAFLQEKYIPVFSNIKLTFSNAIYIRVCEYDKNKNFIKITNSNTQNKITVECTNETKFIRVSFNGSIDDFQIELGEVATDYIPHQSEVYNLAFQQPMLSGDTFVKENENWFEVHGWKKYVFTGEEEISANSIYPNTFNINLSNLNILPNSLSYSNIAIGTIYKPEILNNTDNIIMTDEETNPNRVIHRSSSFSELEGYKQYLKNQYNSGTPAYIWYKLATPTKLPCTLEQTQVLEQLNNCYLYNGITNIVINSDIPPIIEYNILKLVEDTDYIDFYISSNGYLVIPEYNIKYLIDFNSSSIPSMPEAVESSVRIAGRDGDEVLNTTYEPMQFSIVCYTDDNLTQTEKVMEERKINQFLNSIKNDKKTFAIEKDGKFYKVKYNSLLTTINFPKHLQFTIPLKSSESYAKDLKEKTIIGNQTAESDTIKEVGCLITIEGPAQTPKIYLNDYEMIFNNAILQGNRLEINTSNSTITHISNEGVKTNAMVYYNHEFPKIKYGDNTLRVESGIDNERQVSVKWYDLKL